MCEVSIVIPNYNGKQYLKVCLDALRKQKYKDFETILVDNGSKDGSAEYVKTEYPEVRLLALKENTGFCGGVNAGIQASRTPYVILLNNDTKAEPGFVGGLVQAMKKRHNAFACQAKMLQMHDPSKMDDGGDFYCALGWAFAQGRGKPEKSFQKEKKIFSACAGAAIYRRKILEEIGLFDEAHFAYLEDMDICYRAKLRGYENWFTPKARVLHVGSGTSGSAYNVFKVQYSSRNNVYLAYKNMPFLQLLLNLPLLAAGFGIKAVFFARKGFGKEYVKGLKNGVLLCAENRRKKVRGISVETALKIQLELYRNILRKLWA